MKIKGKTKRNKLPKKNLKKLIRKKVKFRAWNKFIVWVERSDWSLVVRFWKFVRRRGLKRFSCLSVKERFRKNYSEKLEVHETLTMFFIKFELRMFLWRLYITSFFLENSPPPRYVYLTQPIQLFLLLRNESYSLDIIQLARKHLYRCCWWISSLQWIITPYKND